MLTTLPLDLYQASLIDNLDASKITTGTLNAARIPTLNQNTTGTANKVSNDIRVDGGGLKRQ